MRWRRRKTRPTSWIGWLFEWWPTESRYVQPAIFVALLVYGIGWLMALAGDFGLSYVTTPQIAALAVAIGWVFGWGAWSTDALRALPTAIHSALRRVVLTFYFAIASPLFMTMLWGFANYVHFAQRALEHPLALAPNLARTCLRPITLFGLKTGVGWSVAATLAAAFFAKDVTYPVAAVLVALGVLGITLIVLPEVLAHFALARTRDELVVETASALRAKEPRQWIDRFVINANPQTQRARSFLGELEHTRVWIYSPAEALIYLVQVVVPIATFVLALQ